MRLGDLACGVFVMRANYDRCAMGAGFPIGIGKINRTKTPDNHAMVPVCEPNALRAPLQRKNLAMAGRLALIRINSVAQNDNDLICREDYPCTPCWPIS